MKGILNRLLSMLYIFGGMFLEVFAYLFVFKPAERISASWSFAKFFYKPVSFMQFICMRAKGIFRYGSLAHGF